MPSVETTGLEVANLQGVKSDPFSINKACQQQVFSMHVSMHQKNLDDKNHKEQSEYTPRPAIPAAPLILLQAA